MCSRRLTTQAKYRELEALYLVPSVWVSFCFCSRIIYSLSFPSNENCKNSWRNYYSKSYKLGGYHFVQILIRCRSFVFCIRIHIIQIWFWNVMELQCSLPVICNSFVFLKNFQVKGWYLWLKFPPLLEWNFPSVVRGIFCLPSHLRGIFHTLYRYPVKKTSFYKEGDSFSIVTGCNLSDCVVPPTYCQFILKV